MAYTDFASVIAIEPESNVIQLTDDSNSGLINTTYFNECVANADSLVDTYLLGKVAGWPVSPTPQIITFVSSVLTVYNLYCRRYGVANQNIYPESLIFRYKEAIKTLEKIAEGKISITSETTKLSINTSSKDQVFTSSMLAGY